MTCAVCGAALPEGAAWCSLCFTRVDRSALLSEAAAIPEAPPHAEVAATAAPARTTAGTGESGGDWFVMSAIGDHQLIASGHDRAWRCGVCGHSDWLDVVSCPVCGTSLFSSEETPDVDLKAEPGKALRWSVVPGGGLWYVGLEVQGATLGALVLLCTAASFMFPRRGGTVVGLVVFAVCAGVLWVIGARDAHEVAVTGVPSSMFLHGRRLFWVALGIIGLLLATGVLGLVAGAMSQPPSAVSPGP